MAAKTIKIDEMAGEVERLVEMGYEVLFASDTEYLLHHKREKIGARIEQYSSESASVTVEMVGRRTINKLAKELSEAS